MEKENEGITKLVALALVTDEDGRVLLQKRIDASIPEADGKWEIPGGKVEFSESPAETARRECREETGCDIEVIRMLPLAYSRIWNSTDGKAVHTCALCFEARIISGAPEPLDEKSSEVKWFTKEEAFKEDLLSGGHEFIGLL